jgi:hypothetical protein
MAAGNVANFAETEQILTIDGPPGHPHAGDLASFLIVRGSIPLLWTQVGRRCALTVVAWSSYPGSEGHMCASDSLTFLLARSYPRHRCWDCDPATYIDTTL